MPYTPDQCRAFGAKASRGEQVPNDWKKHCMKENMRKGERRKMHKQMEKGAEKRKDTRRKTMDYPKSKHGY